MAYISRYGRFDANQAIERGRSRLGSPYVWGTWDCSAFVSFCYFNDGTRWTTASMASLADGARGFKKIPYVYPPKKGDILFYNTSDPANSHTAMATGPYTMIQNSGNVHQGGLYNPGWTTILRPKDDIIMVKWKEKGRTIWYIPGYQNY